MANHPFKIGLRALRMVAAEVRDRDPAWAAELDERAEDLELEYQRDRVELAQTVSICFDDVHRRGAPGRWSR